MKCEKTGCAEKATHKVKSEFPNSKGLAYIDLCSDHALALIKYYYDNYDPDEIDPGNAGPGAEQI